MTFLNYTQLKILFPMENKIKLLVYCNVLMLVLILGAASFYLFNQKGKDIVYVNSNKLLLGYAGMQAVEAEYQATTAEWVQKVDTLQQELQFAVTQYELEKTKLKPGEEQFRREQLQRKESQFLNYRSAIQEKMKEEEQRLQGKVLEDINRFMKVYGKEKGYSIIMAATTVGNIVYAEEGKDVTDDVLDELNAQYSLTSRVEQ